MSQPVPWGFDEAGSPIKGDMELTFSDIKCRKSLKDGEKENYLSQEMQLCCLEQSRRSC